MGIIMDPIESINVKKDSSFAMLLEAQARGHRIWYMLLGDLFLDGHVAYASMQELKLSDNPDSWFSKGERKTARISDLDYVLMRKDPPFNMEYIYSTYILEQAESQGTLVVNKPSALRDANEKLYTAWFPDLTPTTLVSRKHQDYVNFIAQHRDCILKPLDGMGGASIFRVSQDDPNLNVIIETLTQNGNNFAMAQQFIPEISLGDKRILIVDGEPVPYALARIPQGGETRGNLAAGGKAQGQPLDETDEKIARQIGPKLKQAGIIFAGIDVIGKYLTEINVTSPTCIRELDREFGINISGQLLDAIENKVAA